MQLHLDPLGGIAGDMLAAALLDLRPELETALRTALAAAGFDRLVEVAREDHRDRHGMTGSRFLVRPREPEHHPHRASRDILALLDAAPLDTAVRARAAATFRLLADAEARVHGVAPADVRFHEVGAWDSIADIVSVAWLLERLGVTACSCAPLPQGRGWIDSAHGRLPLPAPATALLLEGYPLVQDDGDGERVTPTGAALLRQLEPSFAPAGGVPRRLVGSGSGFGGRTFDGFSNVLRALLFEPPAAATADDGWRHDRVAVCRFEIDDQSGEDLAIGVERLRALPGVLDVLQTPAFGKKGRLTTQLQLLARPDALPALLRDCFLQTSTLGVRWQIVDRALLPRAAATVDSAAGPLRVKYARRPDGRTGVKAESDDLAAAADRLTRDALRRAAESGAPAADDTTDTGYSEHER